MTELIALLKPCCIILFLLIFTAFILHIAVQIMTIMELNERKKADEIIAAETEAEIKAVKEKEKQDTEYHKARMEVLKKKKEETEIEIRKARTISSSNNSNSVSVTPAPAANRLTSLNKTATKPKT